MFHKKSYTDLSFLLPHWFRSSPQQLAREVDCVPGELARAREAAAQAEAGRAEAERSAAQDEDAHSVASRSFNAAHSEADALRAELAKDRADSEAAL